MEIYNTVMLGVLVYAFYLWRRWQVNNLPRYHRPYPMDFLVYCFFLCMGTLLGCVTVVVKVL